MAAEPELLALKTRMWEATKADDPKALQAAVGGLDALKALLGMAAAALKAEPTVLELSMDDPAGEILVVGDTHGHYHDVCNMLETFGQPNESRMYVFNGDYVDRGSWSCELIILLLTYKLMYPTRCYLLRGNHESTTCTTWYGFKAEVAAKWGKDATTVYAAFKKVFSLLPLSAVLGGKTLVLHGGLFRAVQPPPTNGSTGSKSTGAGRKKRKRALTAPPGDPVLGSLEQLKAASKGGMDPDGLGSSAVAADVLWSDPGMEPGLRVNDARGVGLVFGPDVTQAFLVGNNLSLILRSHEGPDARDRRSDLPQVLTGWSLDHDTPAGKLYTVFSAPDYPQFIAEGEPRYHNQGAVAVLTGPTWCQPEMKCFEAVQPRPHAVAYYDYSLYADTDEEPQGSGATTTGTGSEREEGGSASAMEEEEDEVQQPEVAPTSLPAAAAAAAAGDEQLPAGDQPASQPASQLPPADLPASQLAAASQSLTGDQSVSQPAVDDPPASQLAAAAAVPSQQAVDDPPASEPAAAPSQPVEEPVAMAEDQPASPQPQAVPVDEPASEGVAAQAAAPLDTSANGPPPVAGSGTGALEVHS